jgi:nitrogen fixation NifU-like protein
LEDTGAFCVTLAASELYQATILEHNRNPRGYGDLLTATHRAEGFNPICGDKITVSVLVSGSLISDVRFTAQSCALCRASASVLVDSLKALSLQSAEIFLSSFENMIQGRGEPVAGAANAFAAIKDYPARAKCVILPWRTFSSALKNQSSVTTEDQE